MASPSDPSSLMHDLADTWELALRDVDGGLEARATELGVRDRLRVVAELRADLVYRLRLLSERHLFELTSPPPSLLHEALAERRELALRRLEAAAAALGRRVASARAHAPGLELDEFLELTSLHQAIVQSGGPELRRVAFPIVNEYLSAHAIWLWNERAERFIARELFRWLHREAHAVGDAQALETHGHNRDLNIY